MNRFIEMKTFVSNNCIDIKNIDDFEKLIKENNITIIYYGNRTARNTTGKCFLFIVGSVFYVFTYQSSYGIYKNINDYKSGIKGDFENAIEYYISKYNAIKKINDFYEYLLKEYGINTDEIKYDGIIYYEKTMEIIENIEQLKEKYNIVTPEGIIYYCIINYLEKEKEYTKDELLNICKRGVVIRESLGPAYYLSCNIIYNHNTKNIEFNRILEKTYYIEGNAQFGYSNNIDNKEGEKILGYTDVDENKLFDYFKSVFKALCIKNKLYK